MLAYSYLWNKERVSLEVCVCDICSNYFHVSLILPGRRVVSNMYNKKKKNTGLIDVAFPLNSNVQVTYTVKMNLKYVNLKRYY